MISKSKGHAQIIKDWLDQASRRVSVIPYTDAGAAYAEWLSLFSPAVTISPGGNHVSIVGEYENKVEIDINFSPIEINVEHLAAPNIRYMEVYLGNDQMEDTGFGVELQDFFHTVGRFNPDLQLPPNSVFRIKKIILEYGAPEFHPELNGPSNKPDGYGGPEEPEPIE